MSLTQKIAALQDYREYAELNWTGTFEDYLELVRKNPKVTRTAYQRVYDMILSYGQEEYIDNKKRLIRYNFFKDEQHGGKDAVFGLDIPLMRLVNVFKSAAQRYGTEKRVILLHGPVGSSKSTIARLLKQGLQEYSRTPEGALYTYEWVLPKELQHISGGVEVFPSPMHEDPLRIIPADWRERAFTELGLGTPEFPIYIEGDLNPACRMIFRELMTHYKGDWQKVVQHVRVKRLALSEKDRIGIGTFQPKDEKNQDSTELTGDINYRKIAEYGSDSDPRAFNFDGEFNIANRGIVEFIEVLKLDVAFLYDLLGASQEHKVKPKKFAQTDIDEVIIGHTNEAEYKKLLSNEFMEALRDRTIKIDIPYITRLSEETRIYKKDFNGTRIKGKHIAPHTLEVAAMWAVLTRLEDPKKHNLTLLQKLKLYDGKTLPGFTQDNIKELRKETSREGLDGISPRYIQDKISNALVSEKSEGCDQPVHGHERARGRPARALAHQLGRSAQALHGIAERGEGRVRGHREERGAARHQLRRGRDRQAVRELHRQHQGLHPEGAGEEQVHRHGRGAGRAAHALDRGEDRDRREPEGRLPPRDHELHRRARRRGPHLRLPDQRAAAQGARDEAVRGPEGLDQAHLAGLERGGPRGAGQDRRGEAAAHQELRLRRGVGHRRAQLRGQHLRARGRQRVDLDETSRPARRAGHSRRDANKGDPGSERRVGGAWCSA